MNFQFMIYILLGLMLYFYFVMKVKSTIYFIVLLFVLILNEIYNYKNYNRRDLFSVGYDAEYNENYKYDKTLNPKEYARSEFKSVIIPNVFDGDTHLKDGLSCAAQKIILDEKLKGKKLDYQDAYTQALSDMIFPPDNENDNSLEKIMEGEKVDLSFEKELDPKIFNPIFENEFTKDKKCPTVCHLISDENKCKSAVEIPTFQHKMEFDTWRVDTLDKCAAINDRQTCIRQSNCSFDDIFGKCFYDKRQCVTHLDSNNNVECHKRCDFMNVKNNLEKSKMNCEGAKLYNGEPYCDWNSLRKKCVPKCDMYSGKNECIKSSDCKYINGTCLN